MTTITVVPAEKGKYKVLVNQIQLGVAYASKEMAEREANRAREQYNQATVRR